jgi:hypothetical protein
MLERAGHAGRSAERDRQRDKKLQREKRKVAGGVTVFSLIHESRRRSGSTLLI